MLRSITWLRGLTALLAVSLLAASVAEAQQKKEQPNKSQRGQRQTDDQHQKNTLPFCHNPPILNVVEPN